ncbi:MAG: N-acetylmuramoyl-L-alanine amidase [Gemmatimonadetes bacterium]|nr:N-acetylmuramoyl-L-alanine amidase [Gemmatimonadota bacterium]
MPVSVIDTKLQFGSLTPLSKKDIDFLVIHTQGAPSGEDGSAASIHAYHQLPKAKGGRGWAGIGYHFVVRKTGKVERGRPLDRLGAHVQGANSSGIGICCSGNGDLAGFTADQKHSLRDLIQDLRAEFPKAEVEGHRSLVDRLIGKGKLSKKFSTTKTCPGKKVSLPELQQLTGMNLGTPRVGDRRWSGHFGEWLVLTRFVSDSEWYFARESRPTAAETRAQARWSEMPLSPS